jgi:hypothetical protein
MNHFSHESDFFSSTPLPHHPPLRPAALGFAEISQAQLSRPETHSVAQTGPPQMSNLNSNPDASHPLHRGETLRYNVGVKAGFFGPYLLGAVVLEFGLDAHGGGCPLWRWLILLAYLLFFLVCRYTLDRSETENKLMPQFASTDREDSPR